MGFGRVSVPFDAVSVRWVGLESLRVNAELAHFGLQGSTLHAEFGGSALIAADLAAGVAEGANDGVAFGGLERHYGGADDSA